MHGTSRRTLSPARLSSPAKRLVRRALVALVLGTLAAPTMAQTVDPSTLVGKVLVGYQGWFRCGGDGAPGNDWSHWTNGNAPPTTTNMTVDNYPDLTGMDPSSVCPASPLTIGGKTANLFTSFALATEETHFAWMREYGIDGALAQRFLGSVVAAGQEHETVLLNIKRAAEDNGRVFAVEYDLSGAHNDRTDDEVLEAISNDWLHLVNDLGVTKSPAYLQQNGRPLVSLWGIGMNDKNYINNAVLAQRIVTWFHDVAHVSIMAGVSPDWSTPGQGGAAPGAGWAEVYAQFDAIQPWTVGVYGDIDGANDYARNHLNTDVALTTKNKQILMPVILPGSSDHNNDPKSAENGNPRFGGTFFWQQALNARTAGAPAVKIAMFDEVNEGTAIFKIASKRSEAPDQGYWLTLDADGLDLPSDWYLRLAYEIKKGFVGAGLAATQPANPWVTTAKNCGVLDVGQALNQNQGVKSCDGRSQLLMQGDGNLVVYLNGKPVWASNTAGSVAIQTVMQGDGNLVIYGAGGKALWSSSTQGHDGAFARIDDDGILSVVDQTGVVRSTAE